MTTIYVDSRKRVAGSDSDFEVDLGESLHLQSDARLAVCKIRLADSFLSTDLYWVDAALGTLNCLPLFSGFPGFPLGKIKNMTASMYKNRPLSMS